MMATLAFNELISYLPIVQYLPQLPLLTGAKVLLLCNVNMVKYFTPHNSFLEDMRLLCLENMRLENFFTAASLGSCKEKKSMMSSNNGVPKKLWIRSCMLSFHQVLQDSKYRSSSLGSSVLYPSKDSTLVLYKFQDYQKMASLL